MIFLKIEAKIVGTTVEEVESGDFGSKYAKWIQAKSKLFYESGERDCRFFIASIDDHSLLMGAAARSVPHMEKTLPGFLAAVAIQCEDIRVEEITLSGAEALMILSENNCFIRSRRDIFQDFGLYPLANSSYCAFERNEELLPPDAKKKELLQNATRLLCQASLVPELERIYLPARHAAGGHPVHYMVHSDDDEVGEEAVKILLSALYACGRLESRRFFTADIKKLRNFREDVAAEYHALYKVCAGGALVIKPAGTLPNDGDLAGGEMYIVEQAGKIARQYRHQTLTVFLLPRAAEQVKTVLREHLGTMTMVELTEDAVSAETAKAFLRRKAREHDVSGNKALYKTVGDASKTYSVSELNQAFNDWYDNQLKITCYTQYADFQSAGSMCARKKEPEGNAYAELEKMIGLTEAKTVIKQAVDFFKAQKLFCGKGIPESRPAMHMVFSGAPGTAKTTAARLFARIMKQNGLLSVGGLVEVGRADLVGKYVGWTAQIVRDKFKTAKGSVLFIDEAYSLVDHREGLFGYEAINTIVQEMENQREDIVVIFAGYADKMEGFLQKNPGLRSRVAFHVPFADYNQEELMRILAYLAGRLSLTLDTDVREKVLPILEDARREPDFGNGRVVRNMLEKARMRQATRLLAMDTDSVTTQEIRRLTAQDFESPPLVRKQASAIGFR